MEKELRSYKCGQCGKNYKSSASLASHRYRTHPKVSDSSSIVSQSSSVASLNLSQEYDETLAENHQITVNNIRSAIYELRDAFEKIESRVIKNEESVKRIFKQLSQQTENTESLIEKKKHETVTKSNLGGECLFNSTLPSTNLGKSVDESKSIYNRRNLFGL